MSVCVSRCDGDECSRSILLHCLAERRFEICVRILQHRSCSTLYLNDNVFKDPHDTAE